MRCRGPRRSSCATDGSPGSAMTRTPVSHARAIADAEVIDAAGATVLPGFVDSHNHVRLGSNPREVQLAEPPPSPRSRPGSANTPMRTPTRVDRRRRLQLLGDAGWTDADLRRSRRLTGGRPALVLTYDAHIAWLNREAMAIFGITATRCPGLGTRPQDPDTGSRPGSSGTSRSWASAVTARPRSRRRPGYERSQQYERTLASLDMATEFGITTVIEPQNSPDDVWIFERARHGGTAPLTADRGHVPPGGHHGRRARRVRCGEAAAGRRRPPAHRTDQAVHRRRDRTVDRRHAGAVREPAGRARRAFWQARRSSPRS